MSVRAGQDLERVGAGLAKREHLVVGVGVCGREDRVSTLRSIEHRVRTADLQQGRPVVIRPVTVSVRRLNRGVRASTTDQVIVRMHS